MVETETPSPRFIVVSGLIGVGKTTFTTRLAEHLGYTALFEPVESNPYLEDFYRDPETWAYPMQEWLKHRRFAIMQYAFWGLRCGKLNGVVLDRSIHEDTVFAEINRELGTISHKNWETYLQGFQDFQAFMPEPDLYVFLDAAPEVCKQRSDERARPAEAETGLDGKQEGIPLTYLQRLYDGYQRWLAEIAPRIPTYRVDWSEFGPIEAAWAEIQRTAEVRSRFTRGLVL